MGVDIFICGACQQVYHTVEAFMCHKSTDCTGQVTEAKSSHETPAGDAMHPPQDVLEIEDFSSLAHTDVQRAEDANRGVKTEQNLILSIEELETGRKQIITSDMETGKTQIVNTSEVKLEAAASNDNRGQALGVPSLSVLTTALPATEYTDGMVIAQGIADPECKADLTDVLPSSSYELRDVSELSGTGVSPLMEHQQAASSALLADADPMDQSVTVQVAPESTEEGLALQDIINALQQGRAITVQDATGFPTEIQLILPGKSSDTNTAVCSPAPDPEMTIVTLPTAANDKPATNDSSEPPKSGRKRGRPRKSEQQKKCAAKPTPEDGKAQDKENFELGSDGKFGCPRCNKRFNRERHYHSHRCLALSDYVDLTQKELTNAEEGDEEDEEIGQEAEKDAEFRAPHSFKRRKISPDSVIVIEPMMGTDNELIRHVHGPDRDGAATAQIQLEVISAKADPIEDMIETSNDADGPRKGTSSAGTAGAITSSTLTGTKERDDQDIVALAKEGLADFPGAGDVKLSEARVDPNLDDPAENLNAAMKRAKGVPRRKLNKNVDDGEVQPRDEIKNMPIFRSESDKLEFEKCINVDLSGVDSLFKMHIIDQDLNELAPPPKSRTMDKLNVYSCNVCGKVIMSQSHARLHCLTHTDLKPYQCFKCRYSTNTKGNLYSHMRRHTGQLYKCQFCTFSSINKSHLIEHEAIHTDARQVCDLCQKTYSTPKSLLGHVRRKHSNDKRGKQYLDTLMDSSRIKKGGAAVLHQCNICNRKFKKKNDQERHMLSHESSGQGKAYICGLCNKGCSRRFYLERHMARHRLVYFCSRCDAKFPSTAYLKKHLKEAHGQLATEANAMKQLVEESIRNSVYLPDIEESFEEEEMDVVGVIVQDDQGACVAQSPTQTDDQPQLPVRPQPVAVVALHNECEAGNHGDVHSQASVSVELRNESDLLQERESATGGAVSVKPESGLDENTDKKSSALLTTQPGAGQKIEDTDVPNVSQMRLQQSHETTTAEIKVSTVQSSDIPVLEKQADTRASEPAEPTNIVDDREKAVKDTIAGSAVDLVKTEQAADTKPEVGEVQWVSVVIDPESTSSNSGTQLVPSGDHAPSAPGQHTDGAQPVPSGDHAPSAPGQQTDGAQPVPSSNRAPSAPGQQTDSREPVPSGDHAPSAPGQQTDSREPVPSGDHALSTQGQETDGGDLPIVESEVERVYDKEFFLKQGFQPLSVKIFEQIWQTFGQDECEFCGRLYFSHSDYKMHLRTHTGEKPFGCNQCSYRSTTKENLKRHIEQNHDNLRFMCNMCDYTATNRSQLWSHAQKHKAPSTHPCLSCDKEFDTAKKLKIHVQMQHAELTEDSPLKTSAVTPAPKSRLYMGRKLYKCPHCQRGIFKNSADLQKHIWIHEGIKPFKCPLCPHACRSRNNLASHMIRHSMDKPFLCTECGKAYKSKTALRWHVRSHTDGKFKCAQCSYEATQLSHLRRHEETHNVIKRYMCQYCSYSANTVGYLKIHYTKHHRGHTFSQSDAMVTRLPVVPNADTKIYRCLSCDYLFGNLSDMKRHLKMKHHILTENMNIVDNLNSTVTVMTPGGEDSQVILNVMSETTQNDGELQIVQQDGLSEQPQIVQFAGQSSNEVVFGNDQQTLQYAVPGDVVDGKSNPAVNTILQQIIGMSQQGSEQAITINSEDGQSFILQHEGEVVVGSDDVSDGLEPQYVIQYVMTDDNEVTVDQPHTLAAAGLEVITEQSVQQATAGLEVISEQSVQQATADLEVITEQSVQQATASLKVTTEQSVQQATGSDHILMQAEEDLVQPAEDKKGCVVVPIEGGTISDVALVEQVQALEGSGDVALDSRDLV